MLQSDEWEKKRAGGRRGGGRTDEDLSASAGKKSLRSKHAEERWDLGRPSCLGGIQVNILLPVLMPRRDDWLLA